MTKRFCDICGAELESPPYAGNPYLTYPIVREDICDDCKEARFALKEVTNDNHTV